LNSYIIDMIYKMLTSYNIGDLYNKGLLICQEYSNNVLNNIDDKKNSIFINEIKFINYLTKELIDLSVEDTKRVNITKNDILEIIESSETYKSYKPDILPYFEEETLSESKFKKYFEKIYAENYKFYIKENIDKLEQLVDIYKNEKFNNAGELVDVFKNTITTIYSQDIIAKSVETDSDITLGDLSLRVEDNESIKNYINDIVNQIRIPSGIPIFDKYFLKGGFRSKRLYIFGAQPGVGKSLILINFIKHAAFNSNALNIKDLVSNQVGFEKELKPFPEVSNKIFFYFSLENFESETLSRLISLTTYTSLNDIEDLLYVYKKIIDLSIMNKEIMQLIEDGLFEKILIDKNLSEKLKEDINTILEYKFVSYLENCYNLMKDKLNLDEMDINKLDQFVDKEFLLNYKYKNTDLKLWLKLFQGIFKIYRSFMDRLETIKINGNIIKIKYMEPGITNMNDLLMYIDNVRLQYPDKSVGAVYVDYLDLMTSVEKTDLYRIELGNIANDLKKLAKTLFCPVITVTQVNSKGYEDDVNPGLASVTESKKKVEHSDFYASITINSTNNNLLYSNLENKSLEIPLKFWTIYVNKHRNGPTGSFEGAVYYPHMKYYEFNPKNFNLEDPTQVSRLSKVISDGIKITIPSIKQWKILEKNNNPEISFDNNNKESKDNYNNPFGKNKKSR
jgi:replicative DNA helicase